MTSPELPGTVIPPAAAVAEPVLARSAPRRVALLGLFVLLLVSLAGRTGFTFWEPPFDGTIRYDDVRASGGAYWPMNLYLGGPGYAVSWVAAAVFFVLLARGRAGVLNLVGALLTGIGGILFALTITAQVLPFAYAADPEVLPEAEGRQLFDVLNAHLGQLLPAIIGTQIAIALGALFALIGTLISKTMPRRLSIAGIAYVVVFVGLPTESLGAVAVAVGYLLQVALVATIGWFGLRAGLHGH
ncbi:hypothetical protein [Microbispora hainanensis]|uniref:DUF4386 family protein n=1 Tax=Microbispora hainanensis TaxID=568844 RepID=A0A544Y3G7_9ACTN|nr:hypothetical protein [Microbispora hainanensis]TQS11254.1 hypothetical protein FLX08_37355 [Microbispora hainanensis]